MGKDFTELNSQTDFESLLKLSKKHSEGLEYVYESLKQKKAVTRSSENPLKNVDKTEIVNMVISFVNADPLLSKMISTPLKVQTRSQVEEAGSIEISDKAQKILSEYIAYLPQSQNYDDFKKCLLNEIESSDFKQLNEDEQELLTFMLLIALDSADYWIENLDKWESLINDDTSISTRGMAGPLAEYWMGNLTLQQKQKVGKIGTCDALSCLTSLYPSGFVPGAWLLCAISGSATALW